MFPFADTATVMSMQAAIDRIGRDVTSIASAVKRLEQHMSAISDAVSALQAQVAAEVTVEQSAVTLIKGLVQQVHDAIANAADAAAAVEAVKAVTAQVKTSSDALADAVVENTPAV